MYPFKKLSYATSIDSGAISFKWVPQNSSCVKDGSANTGYKEYANLGKVTNDVSEFPLDVNNELCSVSGLPQHIKTNSISDPDYVAPVSDETMCPVTVGTLYSYRRDRSQIDGDPSFHIPYVEYTDTSNNPATFYPDMTTDVCGSFYALSIDNVVYSEVC